MVGVGIISAATSDPPNPFCNSILPSDAGENLVFGSGSEDRFLWCARTAAFPPGWPPQDRLVCSVRLDHRNEARPGGSYQPCRGPVGGPSSSWHHSTPQHDPRALQTRHCRGDYTNTALPEPQLKASTWKPVVSGEPPPSRHHASLAEDGLDRSTAPIGRSETRVADSLCLLRLGVDALARSRTVQAHASVGV